MTPHIEAKEGEIAKLVLMPGDPKRASFIAENYLENYKLVSNVRGIPCYTGTYNNKEVSVMASGMGMPSMAIYSEELFRFYNVEKIIRIGTCGSLTNEIKLNDVLLTNDSYTNSNFHYNLTKEEQNIIKANENLNKRIIENAKINNIDIKLSRIFTTDIFYEDYDKALVEKYDLKAVEMETFALLSVAKKYNKEGASILTVSDSLISSEQLSVEERETGLKKAIVLGLNSL